MKRADHDRVLALLTRHGWNATSFQILAPGFRYWFDADEACVAYMDTGSAWVAASPVCAAGNLAPVMLRFLAAAGQARRRVCVVATEDRYHHATGWESLTVGHQPVWLPDAWPARLAESKSLREQLRRARAKGVMIRQVPGHDLVPGRPLRRQLDLLVSEWLARRPVEPLGFLVQVHPFTFVEERRVLVAELDGEPVGVLVVAPIYAREGWLFEHLLRSPAAPNGTMELLVAEGMRLAREERRGFVTLGLAPLAGKVSPWLRAARRLGRGLYDFEGLRAFKAKLRPERWDPVHLAFPPGGSALLAVLDTVTALTHGRPVQFSLKSARRLLR